MPYRCVHCGYETTARAFAFATGTGISPYGIDDDGAEARAARSAISSARARATLAIRMAPCPRCRRRDRRPLWEAYRSALAVSALILVGTMGLCSAPSDVRWPSGVLLGLLFGGPCALLYWRHTTSQLTSRQVRFDAPPSEAEVAAAAAAVRAEDAAALPAARLRKP
jgi:hypothetical protein